MNEGKNDPFCGLFIGEKLASTLLQYSKPKVPKPWIDDIVIGFTVPEESLATMDLENYFAQFLP